MTIMFGGSDAFVGENDTTESDHKTDESAFPTREFSKSKNLETQESPNCHL